MRYFICKNNNCDDIIQVENIDELPLHCYGCHGEFNEIKIKECPYILCKSLNIKVIGKYKSKPMYCLYCLDCGSQGPLLNSPYNAFIHWNIYIKRESTTKELNKNFNSFMMD